MIESDSALKQSLLFQHLDESIINEILSKSDLKTYAKGAVLIEKGTPPQALYIIKKGRVGIYNQDIKLAEVGELAIMGESLLVEESATATTIALTEAETIEIKKDDFYWLARMYPRIVLNIFSISNNRLRSSNNAAMEEAHKREEKLKRMVEERTTELNATLEELRHTQKFRDQFLANMSHEIRTPMNAVMGMTNLVLNSPLNDKQKFYLEGIKKSSDTLLHIINDILDFSKIEAGKMELEHIDFSLAEVVEQVKRTLQHKAEEKGLAFITDIDHSLPEVIIGDPVRLNQVLMNLAGNAIKFTERGSVLIELIKGEDDRAIKFSVVDTGIGIPNDKLNAVFESFSQANASDTRKYGGTGLGLTISRQLVELMGGSISIESHEGSGTTFSFTLHPEVGSVERLHQLMNGEEQIDGSIIDGLSILVVDDNEFNRIVARDSLERHSKAKVIATESAGEALRLLKQDHFDVILMDVQMPVMNGYEATRQIREHFDAPLKNIPIIALTASALRSDLDKCKEAGMNSFISKPFRVSDLITSIANVLNIAVKTKKKKEVNDDSDINLSTGFTDLTYLTKFCEDDPDRMNKYINMFTSTAPILIEKLNEALLNNDLLEIASQVHSFKTRWIMMGMNQSAALALQIENQCRKENSPPSVRNNIMTLMAQIESAVKELKQT